MTLPQADRRCTPEEYLRRERDEWDRHEYLDGLMIRRESGGQEHSRIAVNVMGELGDRLKHGPFGVYESNLRIGGYDGAFFVYPDVSVFRDRPELHPLDAHGETAVNPVVLVEVVSPWTEDRDRGVKLENYLRIRSLCEYVLVRSDAAEVESYARQPDERWVLTGAAGLDAAAGLSSIHVELPLAEIYRGVDLPEQMHPSQPLA